MGPTSYMLFVIDQNDIMRRIPVHHYNSGNDMHHCSSCNHIQPKYVDGPLLLP